MWPTLGQFTTFEKNRTNVKKKLSVHSSVASFTENTLLLLLFSHSVVSDSETPWTHQAPLSMGLTKQEYWSRLPFLSPGDLSSQPRDRIWVSHIAGRFFTVWASREAMVRSFLFLLLRIMFYLAYKTENTASQIVLSSDSSPDHYLH